MRRRRRAIAPSRSRAPCAVEPNLSVLSHVRHFPRKIRSTRQGARAGFFISLDSAHCRLHTADTRLHLGLCSSLITLTHHQKGTRRVHHTKHPSTPRCGRNPRRAARPFLLGRLSFCPPPHIHFSREQGPHWTLFFPGGSVLITAKKQELYRKICKNSTPIHHRIRYGLL